MNSKISSAPKPMGLTMLFLGDALLVLMSMALLGLTWFLYQNALGLFFTTITPAQNWGAMHIGPFLIQVLLFSICFYVSMCLMALSIPRLKPGIYDLKDPRVNLWFVSFIFGRVWHFELIRYPIFSFSVTRILFLKCLGGKIAARSTISSDLSLYDPHLITIEAGTMIGMKSMILPHYIAHGKLVLTEIYIGEGAQIGAGARIAPDVSIGARSVLEVDCTIDPKSKIPARTTVKRHSTVSPSMLLSEGCVVHQNTHPRYQPYVPASSARPEIVVDQ